MFISSTLGNRSCSAAIIISNPFSSIEYGKWSGCCNFMTFRSTNGFFKSVAIGWIHDSFTRWSGGWTKGGRWNVTSSWRLMAGSCSLEQRTKDRKRGLFSGEENDGATRTKIRDNEERHVGTG
ncbi:uncharacterized protein LOC125386170 isoform X2 [Bombus terrestris]|uniref:Uncharacterized protein LOC125386170 isoform X2 n=1 Tax=Bombus terrestris TaxID=30195 RepID=A0A9C6WCI5_BOMTE|nr:uncharacterized protein LOC125386170 isoform X2 [Bombus terrestris]